MSAPVLAGEISKDGVLGILSRVEDLRTSGVLKFEAGDLSGEVELVAGQLALDQEELPDGRDPVEVFLTLREGRYEVHQRLPPLPVSGGDESRREGSLAVHVPADLMRYCEGAGLTGKLGFKREGRSAEVVYDRGELTAIRVDGTQDADLHDVFGWEDGTFEIVAHSATPKLDVDEMIGWIDIEPEEDPSDREPTIQFRRKRRDDTGEVFLRSVEVALSSIVEEREKRRSPTRTSPPLPPSKRARRPSSMPGVEEPPPRRKREPTVRIVYLGSKQPVSAPRKDESGTVHLRSDITGEHELPRATREPSGKTAADAAPDAGREGGREPRSAGSKPAGEKGAGTAAGAEKPAAPPAEKPTTLLGTVVWVVVLFAIFLAALAVLARLPPLE